MGWILAIAACAGGIPAQGSFRGTVREVRSGGVLELADGRRVQLQGVGLPSPAVRPPGFAQALQQSIEAAVKAAGGSLLMQPDEGSQPGVDLVVMARPRAGEPSLNAALLRTGTAVYTCRTDGVLEQEALLAAAQKAQADRKGWYRRSAPAGFREVPYLNGAVLGLHHQDAKWDYHRQLDELAAAGFRHVCLLFSAFVDKVDASIIRRDHPRTVRDARLIETIRYAKKKKLSIMLLPIVLILEPKGEDWRGVLRPKNEDLFWQSYDRFLAHYADISEHTGVDLLSVGSELGSLENRTATWQRLISNVRGRFRGKLTYSANWDHADTPRFFRELDVVGMTAYFSLTRKLDPTLAELRTEWRRVAREIRATHAWHGRPLIFTELGYASQNGINRDPWNYTMATDDIDLKEQADCFRAFLDIAATTRHLHGAYLYDYFDLGGPEDWSYSPRGKPAMAQWKRWARAVAPGAPGEKRAKTPKKPPGSRK